MAHPVAEAQVRLTLVDRVTAGVRRIAARISALTTRLGFDRIARAGRDLGRSLSFVTEGLGRSLGRLGKFTALLGLGGGGAIAATIGLVRQVADLGGELEDMAHRLNIGVEALQAWQYAAKLSGVESAGLQTSIQKLGLNAAAAVGGNKGMAKEFRSLGVAIKDAKGHLLPTEKILHATMMALAKVEDPLKRNEKAFKLFGKSGVEMVQLLMDGGEGLNAALKEAYQTGHVLGANVAKAGGELGDSIDRLMARFEGFKKFLAVQLIPVFNEVVIEITSWLDANRDIIRSGITSWAKTFANVLRDLLNPASELRQRIASLTSGIGASIDRLKPVVDFLGGPFNAAMIGVVAYITGPLLVALAVVGAAFVKLGVVIMTTPVGWILAGLAAIGAAAYVLYQKWDDFLGYWQGLWGRVTSAFEGGFWSGFITAWTEFNPLVHIMRGIDAVIEYFTGVSLLDAGADLISSFYDGMVSLHGRAADAVNGVLAEVGKKIAEMSAEMYERGKMVIGRFMDGLKEMWTGVKEWFNNALNDLVGLLPDWAKQKLGFNVDVMPNVAAPRIEVPSAAASITPPPSMTNPIGRSVEAQTVQTGVVQAQRLEIPEPLVVHKAQDVNASIHVGSIVVEGGNGTPAEINAAIRAALAKQAAEQRAAVQSNLSD